MAVNFTCPRSKLVFERSSFLNKKSRHDYVINKHFFNHGLDIILPTCDSLPLPVTRAVANDRYYLSEKLPVGCLTKKEFIDAFVKNGDLYLLSHGTRINCDNCIAIEPKGNLIMHLTKDTYEELGLQGKKTEFTARHSTPQKYIVEIPLHLPSFTPGKKLYDRVQWCLTDRLDLEFDCMLSWIPPDDSICPSSVPAYLCNQGIKSTVHKIQEEVTIKTNIKCPIINSVKHQGDMDTLEGPSCCSYTEFYEWLGAVSCGIDSSTASPDSYISTMACPDPATQLEHCCCCQYRGFITPHTVQNVLQQLRDYLKVSSSPWVAMTIHGFDDSPVSWGNSEHGYQHGGENLYTYVIFPDQTYWLYMAVGNNDLCPP